jgi:hypothetical protein
MDVGLIITVAILVLDAIISVWNSYAAGKVSNESRGLGILFYVLAPRSPTFGFDRTLHPLSGLRLGLTPSCSGASLLKLPQAET